MISENEYFDDLSWYVLNRYFKENQTTFLVKHLIDTYNDFVFQKLEQIIEGFNSVDMYYMYMPEIDDFQHSLKIRINKPVLSKPIIHETDGSTKVMTPEDARARNFTYAGTLYVDMDIQSRSYNPETREFTIQSKQLNGLSIGKLPIMVRSNYCVLRTVPQQSLEMGECPYDYGGYFIVNGNEKVVISQDRIAENKPYVFLNSKATTYSHIAEIRSVNDGVFSVPKITTIKLSSKPNQHGRYIKASIHHIKHDIPLFVLFRALGVESDKRIIDHICMGACENERYADIVKELVGSADDGNFVIGQKDTHDYMLRYLNVNGHPKEFMTNRQYKLTVLQNVLRNEFLPHVGPDLGKKALFLGYMVNKLLKCYLGKMPMDDRDSYINKRVDTPGVLMANLFRQYYGKLIKDMRNMVQKEINNGSWKATNNFINVINKVNINKVLKSTIIESGLKYGLATGNWGIKSNKTKQGVAQVLNRMTYNATISHLRRINTPIEKSGKLVQPRKLHATQWGVVCPCECFDPKTPILTWQGIIKEAKDVGVGDLLIDDLGNAVRVKSTCSGFKQMYEVIPAKRNFMSHTVTDNHILTLKDHNAVTIDITIEEYLSLPDNVRENLFIFKSDGINWEKKHVDIDPYIMGNSLVNNDHIPLDYIVNDRATRLAVLAGLVDTELGSVRANGQEIRITRGNTDSNTILHDVEFLATSLGFSCHMNDDQKELIISGSKLHQVPTVLPRNTLVGSNVDMMSPFKLVPKDVSPFVGWQVEGNGRFLLGDMSVTHNTPEGASVGLVKNMALMTYITSMSCSKHVRKCIEECGLVITCDPVECEDHTLVIVNGDIVGYHPNPAELMSHLERLKTEGGINPFTSICWKHTAKEIYVCTEGGRSVRPLFTVGPGNRAIVHDIADDVLHGRRSWNEILLSGAVEYIDVEEANAAMIAMRYADLAKGSTTTYTHLEMHPSLILGVLAGSIPFSDHNQAPRNTYQCLWEQEPVLMEDGTRKAIKDVRVGDRVVTFDPQTMQPSYTKVVNQYVRPTNKTIVKITTETGREIVVTDDHLFMTNKGWMPARDLMGESVRVGVSIHPSVTYERRVNDTQEAEAKLLRTHGITTSDACVLARLLGYVLGGGKTPQNPTDAALFGADSLRVAHCVEGDIRDIPVWIREHPSYMREFVAGFHGAAMTITGFVPVSDPVITQTVYNMMVQLTHETCAFLTPNGYHITDLDIYMEHIGVRYNTSVLQAIGVHAEYLRYCVNAKNQDQVVSFVQWSQDTPVQQYSQFQRVVSITIQQNCMIADITTESENHSFIGGRGGFMVHNSAMGKQAIGLYSTNYRNRYDSVGHTLNYPQKPLVYTRTSQIVNVDNMPCGVNVIVAIATYTGFNQEDSVIMNKSSIDRGLFQSTVYRTYKDQNNKNHSTGEEEVYGNPQNMAVKQLKPYNYSKLGDNGFVSENTCVNGQDIIIGKAMPQKVNGAIVHKDMSVSLKNNETCFVDRNCIENKYFTNVNGDGYTFSKVRVRSDRIPTIGDKVSSRHGQKGTVGMIYRQEDMPFTKDGLVPDIIMNPHAVPSRMTIGQLMECIMGKSCVMNGTRGDGTPFTDVKVEELADVLQSCGLERYGNEVLYNSRTGEMMETEIFMGPTYYQRLKHLVQDKVHCVDDKHEVLTERGWVPITDVTLSDKVATLQDGAMVYAHPTAFHKYPFTGGEMYQITNAQVDHNVTHNHRLWVDTRGTGAFKLMRADEIWHDNLGGRVWLSDNNGQSLCVDVNKDVVVHTHIGSVYCLSVPGEVFYVRCNGKPVWTGNSRSNNGPVVMMTRQPAEGRARDGGLRLGEMEVECKWAHGCMQFTKERFMECSDNYRMHICKQCGMAATAANPEKNIWLCKSCRNTTDFSEVRIPYACKLLFQEAQTMNIAARFTTV